MEKKNSIYVDIPFMDYDSQDHSLAPKDTQIGGSHYKDMAIQPIEYILGNNIPYCEANVIKYISRWRNKNGVEDLKKQNIILIC